MARPGRPRPRARARAPRPAGQPKPWGGGAGRSAERGNPPPGRGAGSRAGALSRTPRPHSRSAMAPAGVPGAKKVSFRASARYSAPRTTGLPVLEVQTPPQLLAGNLDCSAPGFPRSPVAGGDNTTLTTGLDNNFG